MNKRIFRFWAFEPMLLLFLILWSGGMFSYGIFPSWMLVSIPIIGYVFFKRKCTFKGPDFAISFLLFTILVVQFLRFQGSIVTIIRPMATIVVCMMSAHILRKQFTRLFLSIMVLLSVISLILWTIALVPSGYGALLGIAKSLPQLGVENFWEIHKSQYAYTLYFITLLTDAPDILRNTGPFWEPGRFTIFINIALAINLLHNKERITSLRNLILILTNITTFSTTGYVALSLIVAVYVIFARLNVFSKITLFILLILVSCSVWQLDFMSEKIMEEASETDVAHSRFGALFYHFSQIIRSPWIGYGPYIVANFGELETSPNGLTDLLRYYGIPVSLLLYILLYRGTYVYIGGDKIIFNLAVFMAILLLCFSQTITYSPFFYLLYFIGLNGDNNAIKN